MAWYDSLLSMGSQMLPQLAPAAGGFLGNLIGGQQGAQLGQQLGNIGGNLGSSLIKNYAPAPSGGGFDMPDWMKTGMNLGSQLLPTFAPMAGSLLGNLIGGQQGAQWGNQLGNMAGEYAGKYLPQPSAPSVSSYLPSWMQQGVNQLAPQGGNTSFGQMGQNAINMGGNALGSLFGPQGAGIGQALGGLGSSLFNQYMPQQFQQMSPTSGIQQGVQQLQQQMAPSYSPAAQQQRPPYQDNPYAQQQYPQQQYAQPQQAPAGYGYTPPPPRAPVAPPVNTRPVSPQSKYAQQGGYQPSSAGYPQQGYGYQASPSMGGFYGPGSSYAHGGSLGLRDAVEMLPLH